MKLPLALVFLFGGFSAGAAAAADPVVLAAGDIASCSSSGDTETANLLDTLPGTILALGDLAYDAGTTQEFAQCYGPTWGRHKARTYPAPGNHEYDSTDAAGYYAYFGAVAGDPQEGWYSFDLGSWHIISLNSNCSDIGGCGRSSAQGAWLIQDLEAHPAQCTLAFWHHPRFNSGDHHGSQTQMTDFWTILDEHDADVILAGHEHLYERFAPQDASGHASAQGIRQFTVGTGGRSHYVFGTILPNSEKRDSTSYGVLKLTLHPSSYDWQFVPVAGASFTDTGSADCVGTGGPPPTCTPQNGGDVDGDGVCGNVDNCPSDPNSNQADVDQDGWGDVCDPGAGGGVDTLVNAAGDDASESGKSGKVKLGAKSLKLGKSIAGFRFADAGIPAGATIESAFVEFELAKPYAKGAALQIRGQASGSAPPFQEQPFDVSSRAQTNASVSWNVPAAVGGDKGLQVARTADLAPILQELVNTAGWSANSAVVLVFSGEGGLPVPAFESEPTVNARLHVELTP